MNEKIERVLSGCWKVQQMQLSWNDLLPPFLLLFYLDFKQFSSACVVKLDATAVWRAAPVFYIF